MTADVPEGAEPICLLEQFDSLQATYEALRDEVVFILKTAIRNSDLKVHDVLGRVKDRESFRTKQIKHGYPNPLSDMHDIVGVRVVCLFLEDLDTIESIVDANFDVIGREDKTKEVPPEYFGYRAVHYDCQIRSSDSGMRYDAIKSIVFEIQVRTIGQDAWAAVEHHLQYKGQFSIPEESKADINALVGLFHIADRTFQRIYESARQQEIDAIDTVAEFTGEGSLTATVDIGLDRPRLKALLREMYPDRAPTENSDYSDFIEDLASVGIRGVRQLRDLLVAGADAALSSEAERGPADEDEAVTEFADVGFAREAVYYALPVFRDLVDRRLEELLKKADEVSKKARDQQDLDCDK